MRAVVAKRLRKLAHSMSVGMPERQLLAVNATKTVKVTNPDHKEFGKTITIKTQSAMNSPDSFRGIYRTIKTLYRKGIHHE